MKNDQQHPTDASENWLRQTLGGYCPEAPADAWQRIAPHLPQRKRRRPVVFWAWWSAAGGASVLALFWFLKSTAPSVALPAGAKNKSLVAQTAPAVLSKNLEKKEAAVLAENSATTTEEPCSKNHFFRKNSPQSASGLPKNLTVAALAGADFLKIETGTTSIFSEKTTAPKTSFSEKTVPTQPVNSLEKLPDNTLTLLFLAENPLPEFQFPAAPVLPKKTKAQRFWLGIEAAPSLFMQKNMGEMPGGLAFPETHPRPGRGWEAGVSLAFEPLKNWRITLGIRHLQQTQEAQHSATLRLIYGVCLNPHDPGPKEYQFQYAVVYGVEQNDLTLRLEQLDIGSTMPDDEPFTLNMKTAHRSAAWRVPVSIERRFDMGKWQGFVRGGVVVDFSEKSTVQVTHFTEVCQDLCFQNGHVPSVQASARSGASLGWLAGAGIERRISRRAALRFEPFAVGKKGSLQCGLGLGLLFSK
ncbi:MAG: hypothetical protein SFV52_13380 [Saprospiraceae bacterium]|nr:hypothetical protein [Saprospiraceae bacterium]